jgi:hypothetical protein
MKRVIDGERYLSQSTLSFFCQVRAGGDNAEAAAAGAHDDETQLPMRIGGVAEGVDPFPSGCSQ